MRFGKMMGKLGTGLMRGFQDSMSPSGTGSISRAVRGQEALVDRSLRMRGRSNRLAGRRVRSMDTGVMMAARARGGGMAPDPMSMQPGGGISLPPRGTVAREGYAKFENQAFASARRRNAMGGFNSRPSLPSLDDYLNG